jgi:hypothetical protein
MTPISLLYTGGLRGDLRLLPRLHTFIREVKGRLDAAPLLLDLGDSCAPESWHCAATDGRSMLIGLDALGCHAARAEGLDENARQRLKDNLLGMALVAAAHPWHYGDGISVTAQQPDPAARLSIVLTPAETTYLQGAALRLAVVRAGQVGVVQLSLTEGGAHLLSSEIAQMPSDTLPDPTLAGVVDFIEAEARQFQRRGG